MITRSDVPRCPGRHGRSAGFTLIEVVIAMALMSIVLGGAVTLINTSTSLAQSIDNERIAAQRVDRALAKIADEFRKGSLATAVHPDGSTFEDGDAAVGYEIRPVTGWDGALVTGDLIGYRFDIDVGATEGEIVKVEDSVETLLARGVTAFTVARSGNVFIFGVSARSGPTDDRERTATGELRVMARNP